MPDGIWKPISTAPKHTPVLVWIEGLWMEPNVMTQDDDGAWRESASEGRLLKDPTLITHWMPLPPPPHTKEGEG